MLIAFARNPHFPTASAAANRSLSGESFTQQNLRGSRGVLELVFKLAAAVVEFAEQVQRLLARVCDDEDLIESLSEEVQYCDPCLLAAYLAKDALSPSKLLQQLNPRLGAQFRGSRALPLRPT